MDFTFLWWKIESKCMQVIYIMVCDGAENSISEGGDNAESCMFYYEVWGRSGGEIKVLEYTGTESKKYMPS